VVPKALAPRDLVEVYESGEAIVFPPWDPMVWLCLDADYLASYALTGHPRVIWWWKYQIIECTLFALYTSDRALKHMGVHYVQYE
jgi:hypothetical protein